MSSAALWFSLAGRKKESTIPISTKLVPFPCTSDSLYFVKAKGNKMYPRVKNGDLLMCDWRASLKNGDLAVLYNKDLKIIHCKYYRKVGQEVFYEDGNMKAFESKGYVICGQVVLIIRNEV